MHFLLTRPDAGPEPEPLHTALVAAGHRVMRAPLLSITPVATMPPLNGVQALIVTSRNGLKAVAAGPLAEEALALPLLAVGPATAALARHLGFRKVLEGAGNAIELQALISDQIDPSAGALLHLAGDVLASDFKSALGPKGFDVRTEVVYRTEAASALPSDVTATIRQGQFDGVVLMSPRTARVYAKLAGEAALTAEALGIVYFCLSEAVARELAALGSVRVAVARSPNSEEMLALIAREAADSA